MTIFLEKNPFKKTKKLKHNNKKTEIDGIIFDSKLEARFYTYFKNRNDIEILELQPKFILQEKFRHEWKWIREISYFSDFKIKTHNQIFIIDAKWQKTEVFKIKEKMFLKKYGNKEKLLVLSSIREFQQYYYEYIITKDSSV